MNPDRPCPHENFEAAVEVSRITEHDDGPVIAYYAAITVRCLDCGEPFRWAGVPGGLTPQYPTCSPDETELRAPLRPASADSDFGMGLPGFSFSVRPSGRPVVRRDDGVDTSAPDDHGIIWKRPGF